MLQILLALPVLALACAPGSGVLGRTAVFSYGISPPTQYTFANNPGYGQVSAVYASYIAQSDVKNAIETVLTANGISTIGVTTTVNFTPPNTPLVTSCGTTAGQFVVNQGTVLYECAADGTQSVYIVTDSVTVTAPTAIYESQWKALGSQIQTQLQSKNIVFSGTNTVTVQP